MSDPLFIDDGMEKPFIIPADPGRHPRLTGTRRLLSDRQVQAFFSKCERLYEAKRDADAEKTRDKFIADALIDWSAKRDITPEVVGKLHPALLSKLQGIVTGATPDGTELDADEPETDSELLEQIEGN